MGHRAASAGFVVVLLISAAACERVHNQQHAPGIRRVVTGAPAWSDRSPLGRRTWTIEQTFYEGRQYLPAWIDRTRPTAQMDACCR